MNIENAKSNLLKTLDSIDKEKLSLPDLKIYADILKTVSEIQTKSYYECLKESLSGCYTYRPTTISDLKEV